MLIQSASLLDSRLMTQYAISIAIYGTESTFKSMPYYVRWVIGSNTHNYCEINQIGDAVHNRVHGIDSESVMEYFSEVVLPEMTANQINRHQNQGLEDLMVTFVNSKTSLTEVQHFYLQL